MLKLIIFANFFLQFVIQINSKIFLYLCINFFKVQEDDITMIIKLAVVCQYFISLVLLTESKFHNFEISGVFFSIKQYQTWWVRIKSSEKPFIGFNNMNNVAHIPVNFLTLQFNSQKKYIHKKLKILPIFLIPCHLSRYPDCSRTTLLQFGCGRSRYCLGTSGTCWRYI